MTQQLTDLIAYFRSLSEQLRPINSFIYGAPDRIFSGTRSGLEYPILWLEAPDYGFSDNGAGQPTLDPSLGLVVLVQQGDDPDQAYADAQRWLLELLRRVHHDSRLARFGFALAKVRINPISTLSVDEECGYRAEFPLQEFFDLRLDESLWEPAP